MADSRERGIERERMRERDRDRSRDRDHPNRWEGGRERSRSRERDRDRGYGRDRGREGERGRATRETEDRRDRDRGDRDGGRRHRSRSRSRNRSPPRHDQGRGGGRGGRGGRRYQHREGTPEEGLEFGMNSKAEALAGDEEGEDDGPKKEPEKPNWERSGVLAGDFNAKNGVALKFVEPTDAKRPATKWRLYVFKSGDIIEDPLHIHRKTYYLFGRDPNVCDIPVYHPSLSKQHCVLQFRSTEKEGDDGMMVRKVRPYLMDLESTNGTFINDKRIEDSRYIELMPKDVIKMGFSSREYVLIADK